MLFTAAAGMLCSGFAVWQDTRGRHLRGSSTDTAAATSAHHKSQDTKAKSEAQG